MQKDAAKLQDDVRAMKPALVREDFITESSTVAGIFITTTKVIQNFQDPLRVIQINYDGGLGDWWESYLQDKFKNEMAKP